MMVYDSDSTHLCSSDSGENECYFLRDSHGDRNIHIIPYEIKSRMPTCTWYKV